MKKLLLIISLCFSLSAQANELVTTLTANVSSNLFTGSKITDEVTVTATSTNTTTLKFYDSSTTATNYIQAATVRYISYSTNYSQVFTNEANVVLTNTFSGIYTAPVTVTLATNSLPILATIVIPASSTRTKVFRVQTVRGLTVVPNQDALIELSYRGNP